VLMVHFRERTPTSPQEVLSAKPNIAGTIQIRAGIDDIALAKVPVNVIAVVKSFEQANNRLASQAIPLLSVQSNAVPESLEWIQNQDMIATVENSRKTVFEDFVFRSSISDEHGKFAFCDLAPGVYLVFCEAIVNKRRVVWTARVNIAGAEQHELVFNDESAGGVERFYAFAEVFDDRHELPENDAVDSSERQDDDGDAVVENGFTARGGEVAMVATNSAGKYTVTMPTGAIYQNGVITQTEPDGITLSHSKGVSKIYFSELPVEFARRFGYDPAQAVEYTRTMAANRAKLAEERNLAAKQALENAPQYTFIQVACPACGGRGKVPVKLQRSDSIALEHPCASCGGSGKVRKAIERK